MEVIITFMIVTLVVMIIFKYTLINKEDNRQIFKISCTISLVWLILSTVYQNLNNIMNNLDVDNQYRMLLSIYFIYFVNYIIIIVFIYNYWQNKNELSSV